jgi:hypothetical protein
MARADMTADGLDATLRPERPKGPPAHLRLYAGTPVTQFCRQLADNAFAVAKRTGIGGVGAREMFRGSGELAPGKATLTKTAAISLATLCLLGMVAPPHRLSVWHSYEDRRQISRALRRGRRLHAGRFHQPAAIFFSTQQQTG